MIGKMLRGTGALLLAGAAAAIAAPTGAVDLEAAKREIRISDLELAKAVADRSLQSFLAFVDDDAIFYGNSVSRGKEAVSKAWLPLFTDRSLFLKWSPNEVYVSSSGDLGYSIGDYVRMAKDRSGNPETATGSYVSIWRRQPDGKWKIVVDIGSSATAAPARKP
jgi:ketosteroid isomerase-like protein